MLILSFIDGHRWTYRQLYDHGQNNSELLTLTYGGEFGINIPHQNI